MQYNKLLLSLLAVVSVYAGYGCPDNKECSDHCVNNVCGTSGNYLGLRPSAGHCENTTIFGVTIRSTCICDYNLNVRYESC